MVEQHNRSLPIIEPVDISKILLEDILDPTHQMRWLRHAEQNGVLMREVLHRVNYLVNFSKNEFELAKGTINIVTFSLDAIEKALERERLANAYDGGAGQQP